MDVRARLVFIGIHLILITACGNPDRAETILPNKSENCGGSAIQKKYIVHFKNGRWDYVENSNRENFKESYVRPQIEEIDFIEYDQKIQIRSDVTTVSPSAGIDNWGAQAIHAEVAWQNNHRGQDVVVAVIDTGVDVTHTQLQSQIFVNEGESGAKQNNGIDDDNNGFVDDYYGYNFYDNNGDVSDDESHGTHVSGIIAGAHSDTEIRSGYVQGIAPAAKILPIKFLGANGGSLSSAMLGIDYAVMRGAKIINASWGGPGCSLALRQKIRELSTENVLMVVAAGNSGANLDLEPEYPAAYNMPTQITVGALSPRLNLDFYSNYSRTAVHIFAPGSSIASTTPGNSYTSLSGTSMATPFVTGAAAVLLSAHPNWSLSQVRSTILSTVETNSDYVNFTHGRLSLSNL